MGSVTTIILSALLPVVLVATLFYFLDRNPEPLKEILRAFGVGILSVVFTIALGLVLRSALEIDGSFISSLVNSFWNAALVEELSKYSVFMLFIYRRKHFDEWYDGILYGITLGLGFAFVENILYFSQLFSDYGWSIIVTRNIFSMPVHALIGGIMGFFIGWAKFSKKSTFSVAYLWLALLVPIGIHGFFNFFLMYRESQLAILSFILSISLWFVVLKLKRASQLQKMR